MQTVSTYTLDFIRYRGLVALTSLAILGSSIGFYFYKERTSGQAFTYSVDFTGGTQTLLRFAQPINSTELRGLLEDNGWHGATTRDFSDTEVLVRVGEYSNDAQGLSERIKRIVSEKYPENTAQVLQSESVGPGVGAELRWKSIRAVFFALIAMLLYIAFVFWSHAYAFGAVVALFHDALIMLAVCLFLGRDISVHVISAVLAVLGYSINDTIVIFSRIRENRKKMGSLPFAQVVNISINQTLKRTLLTSLSTVLTVGSMFVFGGEALRDFSMTLLVGIVFGTYSSIYIASPVMMMLYRDTKSS